MRRKRLSLALLVAGLCTIGTADCARLAAGSSSGSSRCRTPDASTTSHLRYLRASASSTNPINAKWRGTAVPFVEDTARLITVVSDPSTCTRALAAYVRIAGLGDTTVTEVEVLRASNVFVISNPAVMSGEWAMRYVVDSSMHYMDSYLK